MAKTLSSAIRRRLNRALSSWQTWSCALTQRPELVTSLSGGISNHSFLVAAQKQRFVIRLSGERLSLTPPAVEFAYQSAAAAANIAPAPVFYCPEQGVLVTEYLAHDNTPQRADAVARLLKRLHSIEAPAYHLRWQDSANYYFSKLTDKQKNQLQSEHRTQLQKLSTLWQEDAIVPNHGDLLLTNRLSQGDKLYAIDFEYAGFAPFWCDLAVIVSGDQLNTAQAETLCSAYLERPLNSEDKNKLAVFVNAYNHLENLWNLCETSRAK